MGKNLKKDKRVLTWTVILTERGLALKVSTRDGKGTRAWHKTTGNPLNISVDSFHPKIPQASLLKQPRNSSPGNLNQQTSATKEASGAPALTPSQKRSVSSPQKNESAPIRRKSQMDTTTPDLELEDMVTDFGQSPDDKEW